MNQVHEFEIKMIRPQLQGVTVLIALICTVANASSVKLTAEYSAPRTKYGGGQHEFTRLPMPESWPVPTPQQMAYGGRISALIHFNMGTYFPAGSCNKNNWNACDEESGYCNGKLEVLYATFLSVIAKTSC